MDQPDIHRSDRSGIAALAGLLVAVLVAVVATVPVEWFIATLILVVLAMPAVLIVEPTLHHLRKISDLPLS